MVKINNFISYGWVKDEGVMYNRLTKKMCKLDPIGVEIVKKCINEIELENLLNYFYYRYPDENEKTIKEDITEFILTLEKGGYLINE